MSQPSSASTIDLPAGWLGVLQSQFALPYMQHLKAFLRQRKQQGAIIFPKPKQWFHALNLTDFNQVKVVILGQDPYHGVGQAHGLSFSVIPPTPAPPSLVNIMTELREEYHIDKSISFNTDLTTWARQGVLLLNSVLTVENGQPASHANQGWELLTDAIIEALNQQRQHIVFILWGSYAKKKGEIIDKKRHCVLHSPHPSPLSAHRGFFGSRPFSKANQYLSEQGYSAINWQVVFDDSR